VQTELIHVGFDNHLALNRVVAVAAPGSAPVKRMVQRGKETQHAIDLTSGRRTKAVVVLDNDWVALIAITPETFASRASQMMRATAPASRAEAAE
jgi:extracellular matrix regulatory protein A